MKHQPFHFLRFALALVLTLTLGRAGAAPPPPPPEAFFADPQMSQARLSPDGLHVAFLVGSPKNHRQLGVLDLQTMKPQIVASFKEQDVTELHWVNDQRLVFSLDFHNTGPGRADIGPGLFAVDADGGRFRSLVETSLSFIHQPDVGPPPLHWATRWNARAPGDEVIVARPGEQSRQKVDFFVFQRLNTVTGRAVEIELPLHTVHAIADPRGEFRAVLTASEGRQAMLLRQADGSWKSEAEFDAFGKSAIRPLWIGPDDTLYVQAAAGDKSAVYAFDPATGNPQARPLAASKEFDLYPEFISNEQRLLGLRYTIDAEVTQWTDPAMQALQEKIDQLLPTSDRLAVARHGDSPWVLVEASADNQPTLTYVYHRGTGMLTRLSGLPAGIDPARMGRTDFVHYKARDGRVIPAYLTLPAGAGKNLPMVVLVHGGPRVRGGHWTWNPEVQFMASRGYAVLEPEFRGGAGFGYDHMEAGFKQWGLAMQDDVADAARWAIAQGHADAKRICIAGASYGGYATLMGLARNPELFRCGIEWVGVTDPRLLFSTSWSDIDEGGKKYELNRTLGDPRADAARLEETAPITHAAEITQPLLMAYGGWDTRVPVVHGERFLAEVRKHNPRVEWVVYPEEGHGWRKLETKVDFWGRVDRFLQQQIGSP